MTLLEQVVLRIPYLPPTSNKAYKNGAFGKRVLSKEGEKFKNNVKAHIIENYLTDISAIHNLDAYRLELYVFFPHEDVINKSFGEKNGARSRYKRIDIDNRIKLAQDAISETIVLPDEQFFSVGAHKMCATLNNNKPGICAVIGKVDIASYGF